MSPFTRLSITVERASDLASAEIKATEIADRFYGCADDDARNYVLEQVNAAPEIIEVRMTDGTTPHDLVGFTVEFVARGVQ